MKKLWLIGAISSVIVIALIIVGKSQIWTPKFSISGERWFFGKVQNSRSMNHAFIITNLGNADLTISAWPSCRKCISPSFTTTRIPPQGKMKLIVELYIVKDGLNEASVMLETNDHHQRIRKVTLKAIAVK